MNRSHRLRSLSATALAGWTVVWVMGCAPPQQLDEQLTVPTDAAAAVDTATVAAADSASPPDTASTGDTNTPPVDATSGQGGAALYAKHCRFCHGEVGEGGSGPALNQWAKGPEALEGIIAATMPPTAPGACDATCAEAVAAYILGGMQPKCQLPPRRIRPLSRTEYRNTVADLLPIFPKDVACTADTDCAVSSQSCVAGVCVDDPCTLQTFIFPGGKQHKSVHVAGGFNGWSATVSGGGWAMVYTPAADLWYVKKALPVGTHAYKFVIDESQWLLDPQNPSKVDNGIGGLNSQLTVACQASAASAAAKQLAKLTGDFPAETRPEGYPFDNHVGSLVTAVHVEQHLKAGRALAALAAPAVANATKCDTTACLTPWLSSFLERAFRRPVSATQVSRYLALAKSAKGVSEAVELVLHAALMSPYFLYRFEVGEPQSDGTVSLTGYERAAALSYLFWRSMPDAALFQAAKAGELATTAGMLKQAKRLLADPRARAVVGDFALMWLGVEKVSATAKSASLFPGFDAAIRAAMIEETRRLMTHVTFDGAGTLGALFTANYTFANAPLAKHYGLAGVNASAAVKVPLDEHRAGVLGHGSVLASHAHSDQTSPVRRGLFVRQRLLCHDFPPPPANAGGVPEVDPSATTEERFAQHSADPACASCHQYIDELGFGFERFDAVGKYRTQQAGKVVKGVGDLNDVEGLGTKTSAPFSSLPQLGGLLAQATAPRRCFSRMWWRFAAGQMDHLADRCAVDALQARFGESGWSVQGVMLGLVELEGFARRRAQ